MGSYVEVAMRYLLGTWLGVLSLLALPLLACGSSNEGAGGTGGVAGTGGSAGSGGTAGTGGMAGTGGTPLAAGLWTGSGEGGSDGALTICFFVSEDGDAIVEGLAPDSPCDGQSLSLNFPDCGVSFGDKERIPIVDGTFQLLDSLGTYDISGTFDGNTASGQATVQQCSGTWQAAPAP